MKKDQKKKELSMGLWGGRGLRIEGIAACCAMGGRGGEEREGRDGTSPSLWIFLDGGPTAFQVASSFRSMRPAYFNRLKRSRGRTRNASDCSFSSFSSRLASATQPSENGCKSGLLSIPGVRLGTIRARYVRVFQKRVCLTFANSCVDSFCS